MRREFERRTRPQLRRGALHPVAVVTLSAVMLTASSVSWATSPPDVTDAIASAVGEAVEDAGLPAPTMLQTQHDGSFRADGVIDTIIAEGEETLVRQCRQYVQDGEIEVVRGAVPPWHSHRGRMEDEELQMVRRGVTVAIATLLAVPAVALGAVDAEALMLVPMLGVAAAFEEWRRQRPRHSH